MRKELLLAFIIVLLGNIIHYFIWFDFLGFSYSHPFDDLGDSAQYIGATENLINKGELSYYHLKDMNFVSNFSLQSKDDLGILYAFRTPGFNFVHYPLRLLFDYKTALLLFLTIQVILSAISKVILAYLLTRELSKNKITFWIVIGLFFIDFPLSFLNTFLLTESMGGSFLVFSIFFLFVGIGSQYYRTNYFLSGLFLTIAIFFRPFLIVYLILFSLYLVFKSTHTNKLINKKVLFILPVLLIFGMWTYRNYKLTNEFIPLSTTMKWREYSNKGFVANMSVCQNTALSYEWWSYDSPMYWYINKSDSRKPKEVYGEISLMNELNLIESKKLFLKSIDSTIDIKLRKNYESKSAQQLNDFLNELSQNKWNYFFSSRFYTSRNLIFSKPHNPFINLKYPLNYLLLIIELFISRYVFIVGALTCILIFFRNIRKLNFAFIYTSIPLGLFALFALILLASEQREMFIIELFLLPISGYFLSQCITTKRWLLLASVLLIISTVVFIESFNYIKI